MNWASESESALCASRAITLDVSKSIAGNTAMTHEKLGMKGPLRARSQGSGGIAYLVLYVTNKFSKNITGKRRIIISAPCPPCLVTGEAKLSSYRAFTFSTLRSLTSTHGNKAGVMDRRLSILLSATL